MSETLQGKPLHIDAFELLARLPDASVDLVFCDPPYNIGIFTKMPAGDYLTWCKRWITEASRVLKANGVFWISHKDPSVLVELSKVVAAHGRGRVNWITWDKYNDSGDLQGFLDGYTVIDELRSFQVMAEYLIYHADEGEWAAQCDKERGFIFEPLRAYLSDEWKRAGLKFEQANEACGTASMAARHFFSRSQWCLPTQPHYNALRTYANRNNGNDYLRREYEDLRREYEDLRREYEDLRREYEDLRYTFNNPGRVSSVWQIPPAPTNGHPTPKPEWLLERIIETTTNPGDLVLDFFAGSFTTAVAAKWLGRRWICGDSDAQWVELGRRRLRLARQLSFPVSPETEAMPA